MVTLHFWRVALHWHWPITLLRASWAAISLNHAPVSHVYLQLEFANTKEVRMRVIRRSHKMHYLDFVQQTYSPEFLLCLDTKLALETDRQSGPYTWAIIKVSSEHSRQAVFWLFRNQEIKFLQAGSGWSSLLYFTLPHDSGSVFSAPPWTPTTCIWGHCLDVQRPWQISSRALKHRLKTKSTAVVQILTDCKTLSHS
jgi:hypothetical protein